MAYIKNEEHFINYLQKILRDQDPKIDKTELFPANFYIENIYERGKADQFCWDIKSNINHLTKSGVMLWLNTSKEITKLIYDNTDNIFTKDFLTEVSELSNIAGVYTFWLNNKIAYVGVSTNLADRIISSFRERFQKIKEPIFLKYIKCETKTDAAILELYLIGTLKPPLNTSAKHGDFPTLQILGIPPYSNPVLCNNVDQEVFNNG